MRKKRKISPLTAEDKAFFTELYTQYSRLIQRYSRFLTESEHQAADLAQESCLNLMKNISTLRALDRCKTGKYIVVTIRRQYLNDLKKESRMTLLPIDLPSIAVRGAETAAEAEQEIEDAKLDISMLLDQLSERDRLILQFKYILGMEDAELAEFFDCKPESVRELLHRARKRARKIGLSSVEGDEKGHG